MTTATTHISGVPLSKCKCGATTDLSFYDDRMWCSDCLWNEIKQLRQFIRDDYDRYNSYHPYAHKLRKMFPWLEKLAEKKPDDDRLARLKRQAKKAALAKVS